MKPSAIREMTDAELAAAIEENRRELLNLRQQAQTGQLENSDRIRQVRRDIARLLSEDTARKQARSKPQG
ncbi:MAG: 50S ribosomal protein L29 [Kiritimatiellaeota bacterium]|nr:50S ribosomal protein L29 [Kiritimatiellota bacterium]